MAEIQTRLSSKHNLLTAWPCGLPWALALLTDDSYSSGIHYSIRLIHVTSSLHLFHLLCQSNAVNRFRLCAPHICISFFGLFISFSPTYSAVNSWLNYSSLVTGIFFFRYILVDTVHEKTKRQALCSLIHASAEFRLHCKQVLLH